MMTSDAATGNGKTHYIKKQLAKCSDQLTIAINEAFTPLGAITRLRSLPLYNENIGLFFNFTILPPEVSIGIVYGIDLVIFTVIVLCLLSHVLSFHNMLVLPT